MSDLDRTLDRVREALRASMTAWATLEIRDDQARVIPAPDLEQLAELLGRVAPGWGLGWACDSAPTHDSAPTNSNASYVVRARLDVAGCSREGLASAPTLADAKLAALADMARAFGVSSPSSSSGDELWVEYDPEDGPNTAELDAEHQMALLEALQEAGQTALLPGASGAGVTLPPEPPRDPQMEKARGHIDDLMEQIRAAGKGAEAMRILMRGYGETLEESRAIYKELQGVLKG